jgi:hypothetical protein
MLRFWEVLWTGIRSELITADPVTSFSIKIPQQPRISNGQTSHAPDQAWGGMSPYRKARRQKKMVWGMWSMQDMQIRESVWLLKEWG